MLKFDDKGLIPVIVQDVMDGAVLMLGGGKGRSAPKSDK